MSPYTLELDAYTRCSTPVLRQPSMTVPKAQTFIVNGFVRAPNTYVLDGDITVQKTMCLPSGE